MSPLFIPRLLINLAAGHISMKYGFKVPTSFCDDPGYGIQADVNVRGPTIPLRRRVRRGRMRLATPLAS